MTFEEAFESLPRIGWLTVEEARLLWDLAQSSTGNILEIGTYCGKSATLLANAILNQHGRKLYCCDPFIQGFDGVDTPSQNDIVLSVANSLFKSPTALQVHVCWMTQEELFKIWAWPVSRRFSLVYIDGNHTYEGTTSALENWAPLSDHVAMHDYGGHIANVARAANDYWKRKPDILAGRIAYFSNPTVSK